MAAEPTVPAPRGYVSDYAGVLDAATVRDLDALIGELKAKTGAEIAVVVVDSTQPLSAFDYAMKIAEAWKPGSKRLDNGVVFLVALKDRQMFILTGYGVEGVLPDGKVGEIRDQLVRPAFRRGDYAGGVRAATRRSPRSSRSATGVQLSRCRVPRRPPAAGRRRGSLLASDPAAHHIPDRSRCAFAAVAAAHGRAGRFRGGSVASAAASVAAASAVVAAASVASAAAASAAAAPAGDW